MITKRVTVAILIITASLAFSSLACGLGSRPASGDVADPGDADPEVSEEASTEAVDAGDSESADPESPEAVSQVGEKRVLENHEVTLIGVEYFPSDEGDDDYPEILVVELFVDNTSDGDISYDLLYPYTLFLSDDRIAFESLDCEGKAPRGRLFLDPGTSATYYLCWFLPPFSEAPSLLLTYDYTRELVEDDEVQWQIVR